jgi:hypothetical protein
MPDPDAPIPSAKRWLIQELDPLLSKYVDAILDYAASPHQLSYSTIEIPLIDIGRAVVDLLGVEPQFAPTEPGNAPVPVLLRKMPIPTVLRWEVWVRDNFTCKHCGSRRDLSVDHIIAESKGGPMELSNLQTLCRSCNSRKGAR